MTTVSIMPCLDIKDGRVVKGVQFVALKDAGDPVDAACAYRADGATELAILDITATIEKRRTALETLNHVREAAPSLTITYGGGIASVEDAESVLAAGAHRISVSSAAVRNPDLIDSLAARFGSERVVVALDVDTSTDTPSGYGVFIDGGRTPTGRDAVEFAKEAQARGAGMILPTSKAADGARGGYDIHLIQRLKASIQIPVVASGGAGRLEHFLAAARAGADLLLAASVFHFGEIRVADLKRYLTENGFDVA